MNARYLTNKFKQDVTEIYETSTQRLVLHKWLNRTYFIVYDAVKNEAKKFNTLQLPLFYSLLKKQGFKKQDTFIYNK